jgi:hypothetical protein
MPRRPAVLTQADIARVIRAAKQVGATEVEVREASVIVRLAPPQGNKLLLKRARKSSCDFLYAAPSPTALTP